MLFRVFQQPNLRRFHAAFESLVVFIDNLLCAVAARQYNAEEVGAIHIEYLLAADGAFALVGTLRVAVRTTNQVVFLVLGAEVLRRNIAESSLSQDFEVRIYCRTLLVGGIVEVGGLADIRSFRWLI